MNRTTRVIVGAVLSFAVVAGVTLLAIYSSANSEGTTLYAPPIGVATVVDMDSYENYTGEEEQTSFTVILKSAGAAKLQVVKCVKESLGLEPKEAKDLVDGAPSILKEGLTRDEAESLKTTLEEAGAEVEIR